MATGNSPTEAGVQLRITDGLCYRPDRLDIDITYQLFFRRINRLTIDVKL